MNYFRRILPYLRPYSHLAVLSVVLIGLSAAAALLVPWPLQLLVDNVLGDRPLPPRLARLLGPAAAADAKLHLLVLVVIAGFLVTALLHFLNVVSNYVNTKLEQRMVLDFRSDLFEHAQRLSLAFHDRRRSGSLIYAINFQGDAAAGLLMTIPALGQSVITLVGMFWISLLLDRNLALLSLLVLPFLYYSVGYYTKHVQARLQEVRQMEGESLSIVHEAISMMRVIVAFGRESHEHRRFREQGQRAVDARVKLTVRQTLFQLVVEMTTAAGAALILGFGAYSVMRGRLTVGQLLVFIAYIAAVYKPLEQISYTIGAFQEKFVCLKMAFDLRDTVPEIRDAPGAADLPPVRGHVRFDHIGFTYSGRRDTLKDINFDVPAGCVVALVGPTGAGKTTLISLLPRYAPQSGRVLIDGIDAAGVTTRSLRQQISIVLQEPLLFAGTIRQNIRYGRLDATDEEIVEAAKAANAHEFIMRLPQQYDTDLGERGARLSGGERQRLCIARAFLKDSPILILDEPTSSIDSKTEAVILEALDRLMVGRTTFMIAHRLSTVRKADLILVLDHGQLVQQGTHEQLVASEGMYKNLYDMQTGGGAARRRPPLASAGAGANDPQAPVVALGAAAG